MQLQKRIKKKSRLGESWGKQAGQTDRRRKCRRGKIGKEEPEKREAKKTREKGGERRRRRQAGEEQTEGEKKKKVERKCMEIWAAVQFRWFCYKEICLPFFLSPPRKEGWGWEGAIQKCKCLESPVPASSPFPPSPAALCPVKGGEFGR